MKVQIPEAFADLFRPARYKAFYGGRGSAKSHSFAAALVIGAAQEPLRILCAREFQNSMKDSSKRLIDDKIEAMALGEFFSSTETEIRGSNGALFLFKGLRAEANAIRSMEGIDRVWVEEANTVSQRSLDTLIPTIRRPASEIWFSWNPRDPKDPVDARFRGEVKPPDAVIKRVNWEDNPWFPEVLNQEMTWDRRRDPDKYAHIWLGEYLRLSEARVFRNWQQGTMDVPENCRPYFGADWGFSVDPTVLVRCCRVSDRTLYVDDEAYAVGCEIDRTPTLFDRIEGSRKWPIIADSARPETISYMRNHGFPNMMSARKGPGSVEEGVEFLKSFDIVVHPKCKHTIDELALYSYKIDKLTNEVLPVLDDKKNHVIDALRYAVESLRRGLSTAITVPFVHSIPRAMPGH